MNPTLSKRVVAESLGTLFLVAAVVGSGIMAERLAGGNTAIALIANTAATGAALFTLIVTFAAISGAHFNPAVTLVIATNGDLPWRDVPFYLLAQIAGGLAGVMLANIMFGLPVLFLSMHPRNGFEQFLSEFVATFGLVSVILAAQRYSVAVIALGVAMYISGAYWFTSSTSFANPAVALARAFSDTFTGIRFVDVPAFILAELLGATVAMILFRWLLAGDGLTEKEKM